MEIVQSFLLSVTRVRLSLYEQRILTKIVEYTQGELGKVSKARLKNITNPYTNVEIELPIRYILTDGTKDYKKVRDACRALMGRQFEFYNPESRTYYADTVIHNVRHVQGSGKVSFMVSKVLTDVLYDFRLGYKSYELEEALTLPSPYAVRMYILLNNQTTPIQWSIDKLKMMFGVAEKYKQTADFIKKVIEPARLILNEQHVNSYTYRRVTEEGSKKVVALQFFPVKVKSKDYEDPQNEALTHEGRVNYIALRDYMRQYMGFTLKEVNTHAATLRELATMPDCVTAIARIDRRARAGQKGKGYIVNALRSELREWRDVRRGLPKVVREELKREVK